MENNIISYITNDHIIVLKYHDEFKYIRYHMILYMLLDIKLQNSI